MAGVVIGPSAYATGEEPTRFTGDLFVCPTGISDHDIAPYKAVRLKGGAYWVDDPKVGDRVSLHIVAPDGQIVATYCNRLPVAPFLTVAEIDSPTTGLIPFGFKIRVTYERSTADSCNLGVYLTWLEAE